MIRIFVEGRDKQFLEKYLRFLSEKDEGAWEIISAGGYTKLHLLDQQFKENSERGGKNLVVFDAGITPCPMCTGATSLLLMLPLYRRHVPQMRQIGRASCRERV